MVPQATWNRERHDTMKLKIEFESEHTTVSITTDKVPALDPAAVEAFMLGIQHGYTSAIANAIRSTASSSTTEQEAEPPTQDVPGYPRWFVCQRSSVGTLHWLLLEENGIIARTRKVTEAHSFETVELALQFIDHWWKIDRNERARSGAGLENASWELWSQGSPGGWLVPNVRHDASTLPFSDEASDGH